MRVRAPDPFTLIIVWPIMAQPPMPPKKPVMTLAAPWPHASRVLCEWVSVTSSTSLAVISDSISPTRAMARANGPMMDRVSRVNGTSGKNRLGRLSGSLPSSPTVGTAMAAATVTTVRPTMATSGAGTDVREPGQDHHDGDADRDQRVDRPRHADEVRDLRHEDEDRQRVHEADHHRAGDEPHQLGHAQDAEHDLDDAGRECTVAMR